MAYHLSASSLTQAIRHLSKYGDTDVFPHLPELVFLRDQEKDLVEELAKLDLDAYSPDTAIGCRPHMAHHAKPLYAPV